jgi:hypothetical protein
VPPFAVTCGEDAGQGTFGSVVVPEVLPLSPLAARIVARDLWTIAPSWVSSGLNVPAGRSLSYVPQDRE